MTHIKNSQRSLAADFEKFVYFFAADM